MRRRERRNAALNKVSSQSIILFLRSGKCSQVQHSAARLPQQKHNMLPLKEPTGRNSHPKHHPLHSSARCLYGCGVARNNAMSTCDAFKRALTLEFHERNSLVKSELNETQNSSIQLTCSTNSSENRLRSAQRACNAGLAFVLATRDCFL